MEPGLSDRGVSMIRYRESLGKWSNRLTGGFSGRRAEFASGKKPAQIGTITWLVLLLIWIGLTFLLARLVSGNAIQYAVAALWGFFIGGTMLIFFPSKLLITIVGGIIGTGLSDLAGVASIIDKTAAAIMKITTSLNSALRFTIQPAAAWIFLILVVICCLPAYKDQ
jgi:ABC-type transport system involved in multi-copper enzyme maturation permease subunit